MNPTLDPLQTRPDLVSRASHPSGQRSFPPSPIPAECLFQGSHEIQISHQGERYRLRITRNGKLILTK